MRVMVLGLCLVCVLFFTGCDAASKPTPTTSVPPLPTTASVAPTPPPVPTLTTAPAAAPTQAPVPTATTVPLTVAKTGGDGIWLRASPPIGDKLKAWPDGTNMTVVGPDQSVDGKTWRNVKDPDGTVGWVAGEFLVAATDTAAAAGTATPAGAPEIATPTKAAAA
jgi:hypothetical protein